MTVKSLVAVAGALLLFQGTNARVTRRNGTPAGPSCTDFTPFTYAGCFTDPGSPRALPFSSNISSNAMTTEICVSFCKGNGYRYAGLEYYGECWCGASVEGIQVSESECNFPCTGNSSEVCGGNSLLSVYQDPTFPYYNTSTISDYASQGCWTDDSSSGRTLIYRQNALSTSTLTVEECLFSCKTDGYPLAGVEFGGECYCGVVLGNGTMEVAGSQCNMPCYGNTSETCGGPALLNLYVATDLESCQPCQSLSPSPPVSVSTSSSTSSSSTSCTTSSSTSYSISSSSTPCSTSSSSTSSSTSSSSTPCSTSSSSTSYSTSSSSTPASISLSPTTSSTPSSSTSSPTSSSSTPCSTSSLTSYSTSSSSTPTSTSSSSTSCSTSSSLTSSSTSSSLTSSPTFSSSTSCSTSSSLTSSSTSSSSTSSTTSSWTSSTTSTTTSTTPTTTPKTTPTTIPTTTMRPSTITHTTSSAALCTTTIAPKCEYNCGSWCSNPLPTWSDSSDCKIAASNCLLQVAGCFANAQFPDSLKCFDFASWCQSVSTYCSTTCVWGQCSKGDCTSKYPPAGNPSTPTTSVYTCPPTTAPTTVKPSSTTTSCTSVPVPTSTNICQQPNNPSKGYGTNSPCGGIALPCLTCNNIESDYHAGNCFKLYTSKDSSSCSSYKKPSVSQGCKDACLAQYNSCIGTYAESCKSSWKKREASANPHWGWGDNSGVSYNTASQQCQDQYIDCLAINADVNPGNRCGGWNSGWF